MEYNKNLKLYPKYRRIAMDFLFFYTINVLFLTQIKHINTSAVVLVDTFYALFVILVQIPASTVVNKIGRKKSMILGNFFNVLYLILIINSTNLIHLIVAELLCSSAFSLKEIAEPSILNSSIESSKEDKSKIFSKIQGKAVSGYYLLSAISMILSGFLYEINGYIPMFLSLLIVIVSLIMSTRFEENESNLKDEDKDSKTVSFKDAVKFVFSSKRCKALLMFSAIFYGIITVLATYEITLLEELGLSSKIIGIIFTILNLISAFSSKIENAFQSLFKNRTLTIIGLLLVFSCMLSGSIASLKISVTVAVIMIFIMYIIKYFTVGLYNVFLIKYLSNFTNKKIDTQIFSINSFISAICSVVFGVIGAILVEYFDIAEAMMIFGILALLIMVFVLLYMRKRVGLKPEQYSETELKYDVKV